MALSPDAVLDLCDALLEERSVRRPRIPWLRQMDGSVIVADALYVERRLVVLLDVPERGWEFAHVRAVAHAFGYSAGLVWPEGLDGLPVGVMRHTLGVMLAGLMTEPPGQSGETYIFGTIDHRLVDALQDFDEPHGHPWPSDDEDEDLEDDDEFGVADPWDEAISPPGLPPGPLAGWRPSAAIAALLGGAALARRAFHYGRTGGLDPLAVQILATAVLADDEHPGVATQLDLRMLAVTLAVPGWQVADVVDDLTRDGLLESHAGEDEEEDTRSWTITARGEQRVAWWLTRAAPLVGSDWPSSPTVADDADTGPLTA